jgi:hypothetical protein
MAKSKRPVVRRVRLSLTVEQVQAVLKNLARDSSHSIEERQYNPDCLCCQAAEQLQLAVERIGKGAGK